MRRSLRRTVRALLGDEATEGGDGPGELLVGRCAAGGEHIDLWANGFQDAVAAAHVEITPAHGLKQFDGGPGSPGEFLVQTVDVAGILGDHPANQVTRVVGRIVLGQQPGVVDIELLGNEVRTRPLNRVIGIH